MLAHTAPVPFIGRLADCIGARKVIPGEAYFSALGVFLLSAVSAHLWQFCEIYVIIGTVAGGAAPVPYAR
jgi:hypothetical protein